MDLVVLDEREASCALRALRDVVASNGTITPAEGRFIEVIAELHGTRVDVGSLRPVAAEEVASVITDPHRRRRVVQLAVIAAMVEGDVTSAEAAAVRALAGALGVDEASLGPFPHGAPAPGAGSRRLRHPAAVACLGTCRASNHFIISRFAVA